MEQDCPIWGTRDKLSEKPPAGVCTAAPTGHPGPWPSTITGLLFLVDAQHHQSTTTTAPAGRSAPTMAPRHGGSFFRSMEWSRMRAACAPALLACMTDRCTGLTWGSRWVRQRRDNIPWLQHAETPLGSGKPARQTHCDLMDLISCKI